MLLSGDGFIGDECPQDVITRFALRLASLGRETGRGCRDDVIDEIGPGDVGGCPAARGGDIVDEEVVVGVVEFAAVGEAVGFGGGVEGVERGVAGGWVGGVVEPVAGVGYVGTGCRWEGYVAGAGSYRTFEDGVVLAFDAKVDCVCAAMGVR